MRRLLVVSFHFPPSSKVGGKRFAFISQILNNIYPKLNVLTLKESYISSKDDTISGSGTIHRTAMFPPYPIIITNPLKRIWCRLWEDYLCLLDKYSGWIIPALIKGIRVIKKNKLDLIIATGPPASAFVTALLLSLITKTSLILDYRDPWMPNGRYRNIFQKKLQHILERLSIRRASTIVFCSRIMEEEFKAGPGRYLNTPCYVIPNGFHSKDTIHPLPLGQARRNMVYAGSFYGERSIGLIAEPLSKLLKESIITKDSFRFHVFGNNSLKEDRHVIRKYGLEAVIQVHPRVSYKRIIRHLKHADILLLISGSDVRYALPYKIYDYLSVKKPILAVAPENSAVAEIMRQINCGRFASINNKDSILTNLRVMIEENSEYSFSGVEQYTWDKICHKYVEIIDNI